MLQEGKIWIGTGVNGPVFLLPAMANRHGLIAGATGTGKTVSLKVLAEGFSEMGVPVFLSDIKSDLSGMVKPGARSSAIDKRLAGCGVDPDSFDYHAFPSEFWDVYGKNGKPIQATVQGMGPQLLGRMLGVNETQTGVLNILFRYCAQYEYPLLTLADLKNQLIRMGENTQFFTLNYGNVSVASIGAIQRAVALLEDEGGAAFFGEKEFDVREWLKRDENDRGCINILSADELFAHPLMYSTFLLWMLTRLYDALPERGDMDQPVAVFFFDEAHLLFDDCSKVLMDKIEQVVRLIRSKGVGVYFITQSPADIPMSILGQLGNRVQHALRAYTPLDQKAVKVAAQTFRTNPDFNTEEAITNLKTGEALISCLDADGAPGIVQRATVLPPQSQLGALSEEERARAAQGLPLTEEAAAEPELPLEAPEGHGVAAALDEAFEGILGQPVPKPYEPVPTLDFPKPDFAAPDFAQAIPSMEFPVSPSTPEPVQENTGEEKMSQTFKVYDPTTGQYVEQEKPEMTPVAAPVAAQPDAPAVPTIQVVPETPVAPAAPVAPVQPATPVLQQMPVMVLDQASGQYVQQMMWMQQDPATGNWIPLPQMQPVAQTAAPVAPAAPVDPIALAEQQKAQAAAQKEAEKAALLAQKEAEKAEKEAAKLAKEQEAAERRARNDALREEAAERARKNDSVAGRIKNTAIQTATRQVTSSLTKGLTNAISDLFGANGKKK
ncbi:MAG: DUF853 family protein [Clostridia bacterium]|nr:DUF853 family protein [Clostridia bacterium]